MLKQHFFRFGFILFSWLFLLTTSQNVDAQGMTTYPNRKPNMLSNIFWVNDDFGIGTAIEFSKTNAVKGETTFRAGKAYNKPGFAADGSKHQAVNQFIEAAYQAVIDRSIDSVDSESAYYEQLDYNYFIHDSIISLLVTHSITYPQSEGTFAFSLIHYDIKNQTVLLTNEVLSIFGLSRVPILNAIAEQCVWPDDSNEPLFDAVWFDTIKWTDINQLKIFVDNEQGIHIIYPLVENGIEQVVLLK